MEDTNIVTVTRNEVAGDLEGTVKERVAYKIAAMRANLEKAEREYAAEYPEPVVTEEPTVEAPVVEEQPEEVPAQPVEG